ncbi:MAG TPA: response regulator [Sphingomonadaceae bacterium]
MIILLVEDNEGDIALTQIAFGDSGIDGELVVARDGAEAVDRLYGRGEFADAELPDLMLVDLNMPRMDGKELLDVVKGDEDLKTIPVIMLTSSQAPAEIRDCYRRHANSYVLKPWGVEEYADILRQLERYWTGIVVLPKDDEEPERYRA